MAVPSSQSLIPAYSIRVSRRARRVRLTYSAREGLVVVVPRRFSQKHVPRIVQDKAEWIKNIQRKLEKEQESRDPSLSEHLPACIRLPAIGVSWEVAYTPASRRTVFEQENNLTVTAGEDAPVLLRRWLHRKAREYLIPWLERVSRETGLGFSAITIRNQKSRWGSCSRHKRISLNQKLLFLPPHLVEYLLVHELCHIRQLNHSVTYWKLVSSFLPKYRGLDRELRRAWQRYVPAWAEN